MPITASISTTLEGPASGLHLPCIATIAGTSCHTASRRWWTWVSSRKPATRPVLPAAATWRLPWPSSPTPPRRRPRAPSARWMCTGEAWCVGCVRTCACVSVRGEAGERAWLRMGVWGQGARGQGVVARHSGSGGAGGRAGTKCRGTGLARTYAAPSTPSICSQRPALRRHGTCCLQGGGVAPPGRLLPGLHRRSGGGPAALVRGRLGGGRAGV